MENNEKILKEKYNEIVERWKKYEAFVNDKNVTMAEKLKWVQQAQKLTNDMSALIDTMKGEDIIMTEKEMFEGFENLVEVS